MRVKGACVLVTGAGAGIGRAATLQLLRAGCAVTALDLSESGLDDLRREAGSSARLLTVKCDVSDDQQQVDAFQKHMQKWGRLDVALLIAGIGESGRIFRDEGTSAWQKTLDIDLRAVLVGVHLATGRMVQSNSRGVIISVASAAGVFPMPEAPVYAAAKGGLVHFTRSSATAMAKLGLRICTVCPQGVDTQLVAGMETYFGQFGPMLQTQVVVDAMLQLIEDDSKNGVASVIMQSGKKWEYTPDFRVGGAKPRQPSPPPTPPQVLSAYASRPVPATYRKWQVQRLSTSFTEACELVPADMPATLGSGDILVRRLFSGINASDINFTSGKYHGSSAAAAQNLPFDAGFESVGVVLRAGANAGLQVGQAVATLTYGGFSEYAVQRASHTFPITSPSPEAVAMLTSGLTASVALKEAGRMTKGETVLVTAAAGGTGMFAVQLAKLAGNHVIGTCSSPEKAALLKQLGVDRVVNYKAESIKEVLKREYPHGVDIIYESVGGEMFEIAVNALANKGRLIVIGMMSQYGDGWPVSTHPGLPEKLLKKSATLSGFFLPMYAKLYKAHLATLFGLMDAGKLKVVIDPTPFVGIEAVPKAVAYLQSGASKGKVVVQIVGNEDLPSPRTVSRL